MKYTRNMKINLLLNDTIKQNRDKWKDRICRKLCRDLLPHRQARWMEEDETT